MPIRNKTALPLDCYGIKAALFPHRSRESFSACGLQQLNVIILFMGLISMPHRFQAAVEQSLSLAFQDKDGRWEGHDYRVTVVTERLGLNEHDVVMDFRVLEAALRSVLEPLRGCSLGELGMKGPLDVAKMIAEALAPTIVPPVKLVAVYLQDGTGRRLTLQL